MISSGGTVYAIVKELVEEKDIEEVYLGVSHNLGTEWAQKRLEELHARYCLREVVVTDSIPQTAAFKALPCVSVKHLSESLARVINRIHCHQSVSALFRLAPTD